MDHHAALMQYLRMSALGVEIAQSNAAWMLKHGYGCASTHLPCNCLSAAQPEVMCPLNAASRVRPATLVRSEQQSAICC